MPVMNAVGVITGRTGRRSKAGKMRRKRGKKKGRRRTERRATKRLTAALTLVMKTARTFATRRMQLL
eukprot:3867709-Pleurochrysis_carterae.AAC.1